MLKLPRVPKVSTNPLLGNFTTKQFLLWLKLTYIMHERQFMRIQQAEAQYSLLVHLFFAIADIFSERLH